MSTAATSSASRQALMPSLGARQAQVLALLEEAPGGLAAWEFAVALGWHKAYVMPRLTELKALGLVRATEATRVDPMTDRACTVWIRSIPDMVQARFPGMPEP